MTYKRYVRKNNLYIYIFGKEPSNGVSGGSRRRTKSKEHHEKKEEEADEEEVEEVDCNLFIICFCLSFDMTFFNL